MVQPELLVRLWIKPDLKHGHGLSKSSQPSMIEFGNVIPVHGW